MLVAEGTPIPSVAIVHASLGTGIRLNVPPTYEWSSLIDAVSGSVMEANYAASYEIMNHESECINT